VGKREAEPEGAYAVLRAVLERGPASVAEVARAAGVSRSWAWKVLRRLEAMGAVKLEGSGGVVKASPGAASYKALLRVGVLRAAEYPYVLHFAKSLKDLSHRVEIVVRDEALSLALELAFGRVHVAFAPAVTLLAVHRLVGGVYVVGSGSRGGAGLAFSRERAEGPVATTRASTMELCVERAGLAGRRLYAKSGREILEAVLSGRASAGALWQPYLSEAEAAGLEVAECEAPFCCLLGVGEALASEAEKLKARLERSMERARAGLVDLGAYADLVGFEKELVERAVASYEFLEDLTPSELKRELSSLRLAAMPEASVDEAVVA